ncbi:Sec-independent protein translocase protein TatB [Microvirga terricola]|uniref:Sec-independent protein translocase protein TatB n=1 Tax=Microvirga terricola TaxID=2719797 RepID=A0ABX0VBL5_9HYPH|nr:Sec-independent protein translocase protein TatB [Microvirga terricola]NIX77243.1 twin-arginine translocase subunit TatB [Microvirga terricola]
MFDMSWGEVLVIGGVALIVIGPKDLPRALRTVGQVTGKIRRMAAEFQGQFQEAMREAELDDVKQQLQGMNESVSSMNKGFNPIQTIRDELKSAVETPVAPTEKPASEPVANAPAEGAATPDPVELPIPTLPPVEDPAELIAESLRREAEAAEQAASPAPTPNEPDAKS